jgi:hypothetical protein
MVESTPAARNIAPKVAGTRYIKREGGRRDVPLNL